MAGRKRAVRGKRPSNYNDRVIAAFNAVSKANDGGGASPLEVTNYMARKKWISTGDSVLDIHDLMMALRNEGKL